MKGKLFSKSGEYFIETFDLYKFNHPAELEISSHPENFEFKAKPEIHKICVKYDVYQE